MDMIQAGILGVAGVLLAVQFKGTKTEYGIYISIAVSLLIFYGLLSHLRVILDVVERIGSYIHMDSVYTGTLLKMLGTAYIAEFASSICKDAGYQAVAGQIEIFGKLAILVLCMPILLTLFDTIEGFLA